MTHDPLRIGDAARILGVSEDHLRDLTPRGRERIPCTRTPGGHRLFDPAVIAEIKEQGLDAWTQANPKDPVDPIGALCRRSHMTVTAGIQVIDFGNAMVAGFGAEGHGHVTTAPRPETFTLLTDTITWAHIDSIALILDPLVLEDAWDADKRHEATTSYTRCTTALLAGQVSLDSSPVAQVLPVADLRVIRAGYESEGIVSPLINLNPDGIMERARLRMPPKQVWRVHLTVPSRAVNTDKHRCATPYEGYVYLWTGVIQITQRNQVNESTRRALLKAFRDGHQELSRVEVLKRLTKEFPGTNWDRKLREADNHVHIDKTPVETHADGGAGYYRGDPKD